MVEGPKFSFPNPKLSNGKGRPEIAKIRNKVKSLCKCFDVVVFDVVVDVVV